jgi:hypothetical protein
MGKARQSHALTSPQDEDGGQLQPIVNLLMGTEPMVATGKDARFSSLWRTKKSLPRPGTEPRFPPMD